MATKSSGGFIKPWILEILAISSSIIMVAAMVVLLLMFDRKPIFESKVWTLNAFISILSTASRVTLLMAVANCVSQSNWILFSGKPRRLYDFEMISAASRGPLGSLKVLMSINLRGGGIVRLGAFATILALAMDPFAQQLIQIREIKLKRVGQAEFAYASRYSQGSPLLSPLVQSEITDEGRVELSFGTVYANADFAMQAAITLGLATSPKTVESQSLFSCSGTECDFPPLESLSVCSRCSDITDMLKRDTSSSGGQFSNLHYDKTFSRAQANSTQYQLPNGLFLNNIDDYSGPNNSMVYMTMVGTSDPDNTVAMKDIDTLIWSQSVIKVDAKPVSGVSKLWPDFEVNASECALYYCVRRYTGTFKNGEISLNSTELPEKKRAPESWEPQESSKFKPSNKLSEKIANSLAYDPQDSIITRTDLQLRADGEKTGWNVSDEAVYGISYYMQTFFASCLNSANCTDDLDDWDVPNGFYLSTGLDEEYRPDAAKVFWETDDLQPVFGNVAASMSNAIRSGADGAVMGKGDVLQPTTIYVVSWPWILLHGVAELGALILLILTIISAGANSCTVPVWKSSELAVLSSGAVLGGLGELFNGARTVEDLEERASKARAVLVSADDGGHGNGREHS